MRLVPFRSCALLFLLGFPCLEAHFDFVDNTESFRLVLHDKITVSSAGALFVSNSAHILDVSYNDACQYRIRLQMIEMCNLPGFNAPDDATSMFCRRYIHPERVQQLMDVLRQRERKRQKALARFANYVEEIESDAEIMAAWNSMNYGERDQFVFSLMKNYDALDDYRYLKADTGPLAAYTVKVLARALENPEEPFSEEELQHFEDESEYSRIYNLLLVDRLMGIIEEEDDETELEEGTVEQIRTAYERVQQDEEEGVHMHDYEAEMRRMPLSKEEILRVLAVFRHEDNIKPLTEEDLISAWRSALYGKQQ